MPCQDRRARTLGGQGVTGGFSALSLCGTPQGGPAATGGEGRKHCLVQATKVPETGHAGGWGASWPCSRELQGKFLDWTSVLDPWVTPTPQQNRP